MNHRIYKTNVSEVLEQLHRFCQDSNLEKYTLRLFLVTFAFISCAAFSCGKRCASLTCILSFLQRGVIIGIFMYLFMLSVLAPALVRSSRILPSGNNCLRRHELRLVVLVSSVLVGLHSAALFV